MMNYLSVALKAIFFTLLFPYQAMSHQMKEAISLIYFNHNTSHVEIAHRVYVHDAEVVLKAQFGKEKKLLEQSNSQADFAQYIVSHFSLQFESKPLNLKLLGQEIKGQHLWVYQETPFSQKPSQITVKYSAMMDHWSDQRNVINVEGLGKLKSIELFSNDYERVIDVD